MDHVTIDFAHNLKRLRKSASMTRSELAALLSYSEKSVEKWESGATLPPLQVAYDISRILGVSLNTLVSPQNSSVRFFLGIDGGGTKTTFRLEDTDGRIVSELTLGPSNPNDIGMASCQQLLEKGIAEVCRGINLQEVSMFAGISGGGMSGNNVHILHQFFYRFGFARFGNGSDLENALELALHGENGVVVILGTGVIAYAQKDGVRKRVGGWGYLFDDSGSGYNLGRDALYAALCASDGTGAPTALSYLLEQRLGKPVPDAIADLYAGGKQLIASFAQTLFVACDQRDPVALEILDKNMAHVARLISVSRDYVANEDAPLVLCGGLCNRMDLLKPALQRHLPSSAELHFTTEPMIHGAVMLARKEKKSC